MKKSLSIVYVICSLLLSPQAFPQHKTNVWKLPGDGVLNFNTTPPTYNKVCYFWSSEASASISDNQGNLMFFTNGDSICNPSGNNIQNGHTLGLGTPAWIESTTQGSLIVPFLKNDSLLYIFTNNRDYIKFGQSKLTYAIIDKNANGGNGAVILKQQLISSDTLTEKMVVTKHCNGNYYWLVVIKYTDSKPTYYENELEMYGSIFYAYLVDDSGVRSTPIPSKFDFAPPNFGQLKFNVSGTQLAYATDENLYVFDFDNATGKVILNKKISYSFENGYGLEWSPDGKLIYVNEKQVELATGNVYSTQGINATQLQLGRNGKIYGYQNIDSFSFIFYNTNNLSECFQNKFLWIGTFRTKLFEISNPNALQVSCNLNKHFIDTLNQTNNSPIPLPNIPHFLLFEDSLDFTYQGNCLADTFHFTLTNTFVDSVFWEFIDENKTSTNLNPSILFSNSGTSEVVCTIFVQGIPHVIRKCITVIGENTDIFDNFYFLCPGQSVTLTATEYVHSNYYWSNGNTTASVTLNQPGSYSLQTSNTCGLFTEQFNIIEKICSPEINIPNVITCNNDQVNDIFSIQVKQVKKLDFYIINRWGQNITSGQVDNIPMNSTSWVDIPLWNGTSEKGLEVLDGVYFYKIDLQSSSGDWITKHGFITVFN